MAISCLGKSKEIGIEILMMECSKCINNIEENFAFVNELFNSKKETLLSKELEVPINRLMHNIGEIEKIFKKVNSLLVKDDAVICYLPAKKFKSFLCNGFSLFIFLVGFFAIVIKEVSEIEDISKAWKWTGYTFCIAAVVLSKVGGDKFLLSWGNEQESKKRLQELKTKCYIILAAKTTLQVLNKYHEDLQIKEGIVVRKQSKLSKPSFDETFSELGLYDGLESTKKVMATLRGEAMKTSFRRSGIFPSWKNKALNKSESTLSLPQVNTDEKKEIELDCDRTKSALGNFSDIQSTENSIDARVLERDLDSADSDSEITQCTILSHTTQGADLSKNGDVGRCDPVLHDVVIQTN